MSATLIDQLKAQIDAQHQNALEALEVISKYLSADPQATEESPASVATNGKKKSFRQQIMETLKEDGEMTIDALVRETRLTKSQVRGVLYAPNLAGTFNNRVEDGTAWYSLAPPKSHKPARPLPPE